MLNQTKIVTTCVATLLILTVLIMATNITANEKAIKISQNNIYDINFVEEWAGLKKELSIDETARINSFELDFNKYGQIDYVYLDIIVKGKDGYKNFVGNFNSDSGYYIFNKTTIEEWQQYDKLVLASFMFKNLDDINIKEYLQLESNQLYSVHNLDPTFYSKRGIQLFALQQSEVGSYTSVHDEIIYFE